MWKVDTLLTNYTQLTPQSSKGINYFTISFNAAHERRVCYPYPSGGPNFSVSRENVFFIQSGSDLPP